ncbi:MAG TPA: acyl-CoA dehydrogenase family protein [Candidatus Nitrosotenuis sp.]|nr:acyl-CoA dehydrogenase family protein [Candidatus Nitrosotenuis sp.]
MKGNHNDQLRQHHGEESTLMNLSNIIDKLGPRFAERAAQHDATDAFVAENFEELKREGVFWAGIPEALGGGGAPYSDLCAALHKLAGYCGSTALALSMHLHVVALLEWRRQNQQAPVDAFLRRLTTERLIVASSGGSDWLQSSGTAEAVEGGFRITGRKIFSSGCPAADLISTSAVHNDPEKGPTVIHFIGDLHSPQVKILDTWRTLGMRGTGSHDLLLEGLFVPEAAVSVRRPQGKWHPLFHMIAKIAFPLIYSVYAGIAQAARDLAIKEAAPKRENADTQMLAGELDSELAVVRMAWERMLALGNSAAPGPPTTSEIFIARQLVARAGIRTVEKAIELVGGRAFYRSMALERMFRDIQAARFHPLQEKPQIRLTGRLALGLDIDG